MVSTLLLRLRVVALVLPLFGVASSVAIGCGASVANDVSTSSAGTAKPGYGDYGYYGYGYGYDGYGYGYGP